MNTHVASSTETVGARILSEMARQKSTGMFFTFRQRMELRRIDDRRELRRTLAKWGFGEIDTAGTEAEILNAIGRAITPWTKTMVLLSVLDIVIEALRLGM